MRVIRSGKEYIELLRNLRLKRTINYNNLSLSYNEVNKKISAHKLSYFLDESCLIIFDIESEKIYIQLFDCFLSEQAMCKIKEIEFIVDITYKIDNFPERMVNQLLDISYPYARNIEMIREKENLNTGRRIEYISRHPEIHELEAVYNLCTSSLDLLSNPIVNAEDLFSYRDSIFVISVEDQVLACVFVSPNVIGYKIEHLVVSEKFRGSGIGQLLLKDIIDRFSNHKLSLWVSETNLRAIVLYEKNSFKKSRNRSLQIVRKRNTPFRKEEMI